MDEVAGPIRSSSQFANTIEEITNLINSFDKIVKIDKPNKLWLAYRLRDALLAQQLYITAMDYYVSVGGKSRGSAIYTSQNGDLPEKMEEIFRFELDDGSLNEQVFEITLENGVASGASRPVRPLPEGGGFFENVWRDYRENKNIY